MPTTLQIPEGYTRWADAVQQALLQASSGKGRRHYAGDLAFDQQPILMIARRYGLGFLLGQIDKKIEELPGLARGFTRRRAAAHREAQIRELCGVVNYAVAAIIFLEETQGGPHATSPDSV